MTNIVSESMCINSVCRWSSCTAVTTDRAVGFSHPTPHQWTTLYHGYTHSAASVHSHMRALPPGMQFLTTFMPWLIQPSSKTV